jgi:glutathione S-transferase
VPVLVTSEGVYRESHDILVYADSKLPAAWRLYPDEIRDDVIRLERRLDSEYGVETRRLLYGELASAPSDFVLAVNNQTAPSWEQSTMLVTFPVAKQLLLRYLDVRPETIRRAERRVHSTLDAMGRRLADGRSYLCGDRMTGADVAFAALSAPLVLPHEYGLPLPDRSAFPEGMQRLVAEFAGHPAVEHARRLYATERRKSVPLDAMS